MSKQCLDVQQMQHLQELGLELKETMLYWVVYEAGHENNFVTTKENAMEVIEESCGMLPAYTLQDVLDALPKRICDKGARRESKNALFRINKALHELGKFIGVQNLTMYVARHSWASACKASNIPISVISEGMGHDSEETTRIYLAQLDTSVVDKANLKIIRQVTL